LKKISGKREVNILANIKSAKKRIKVTARKTLRNKMIKSFTRTVIKRVIAACEAHNRAEAQKSLVQAVAAIDKAASKGIFHKNNAARKKSRLAKMVNKVSA